MVTDGRRKPFLFLRPFTSHATNGLRNGKRPAWKCNAANDGGRIARRTGRRPATDRPSVRTMRRALHPLQQPAAVLSTVPDSCSPGTGEGTEPSGASAKVGRIARARSITDSSLGILFLQIAFTNEKHCTQNGRNAFMSV